VLRITQIGSVNINKAGTYVLIYSAVDVAGNSASVMRTVIVQDALKPLMTLNGESVLHLHVGDIYTEAGATANDNLDGEVTVSITGNVDTSEVGTYVITYSATDRANNTATITRTIIVELAKDTSKPVVQLNGENEVSIRIGESYEEKGAVAIDDRDGVLEVSIIGQVDTQKAGTYVLYYKATDVAGNTGQAIRNVVVVSPKTKSGGGGGSMGWLLILLISLIPFRGIYRNEH